MMRHTTHHRLKKNIMPLKSASCARDIIPGHLIDDATEDPGARDLG